MGDERGGGGCEEIIERKKTEARDLRRCENWALCSEVKLASTTCPPRGFITGL